MNLSTGHHIYRLKCYELATPYHVVKRVATLAKKVKAKKYIIFKNRNMIPWEDADDSLINLAVYKGVYHGDIGAASDNGDNNSDDRKYISDGI